MIGTPMRFEWPVLDLCAPLLGGDVRSLFSEEEWHEVRFYNTGTAAMVRQWACEGMVEPPRTMATCFANSAPERLKEVLEAWHGVA